MKVTGLILSLTLRPTYTLMDFCSSFHVKMPPILTESPLAVILYNRSFLVLLFYVLCLEFCSLFLQNEADWLSNPFIQSLWAG